MPSTISAGTTAGTAIAIAGDTTGALAFQTNGTTTAMTIDTSQNVGIGTTSPNNVMTTYRGAGVNNYIQFTNATTGTASTDGCLIGVSADDTALRLRVLEAAPMLFTTSDTERMRIASGGQVLVNTTVNPVSSGRFAVNSGISSSTANVLELQQATDGNNKAAAAFGLAIQNGGQNTNAADLYISTASGGSLTERMRVSSAGTLFIGATSSPTGTQRLVLTADGGAGTEPMLVNELRTGNSNENAIRFYRNGSQVGTITTNASNTSYNTSSDYRLKENIAPMTGALAKIAQLKPCTYTWKATGEAGEGFIAHELQAVIPDAVTGEKDGTEDIGNITDADGNIVSANVKKPYRLEEGLTWTKTGSEPIYQGIDTSFLVATLTAAIQELKAELDATKAEVAALKGA